LQPISRLYGRITEGLTPWRRLDAGTMPAAPSLVTLWSERWVAPEARLEAIEASLRAQRAVTLRGGDFDRWDLEVRGGMLGGMRLLTAVEEHGAGRQLTRVRMWPRYESGALATVVLFAALAAGAGVQAGVGATIACAVLGLLSLVVAWRIAFECSSAMGAIRKALARLDVAPVAPVAAVERVARVPIDEPEPAAEPQAGWSLDQHIDRGEYAAPEANH
jgi:hypothetical protein